jgi:hypothetical protein
VTKKKVFKRRDLVIHSGRRGQEFFRWKSDGRMPDIEEFVDETLVSQLRDQRRHLLRQLCEKL